MNAAIFAAAAEAVGAVEHGAKSGGLPQLNPHDFSPQLIWLAITFAVLYFLMSRVALPRVGNVLEERKARIARDLAAASQLKAETDAALAAYEQAHADARSKASGLAKSVREKLAADTEREKAAVDRQIAQKIASAETQIAATKSKALTSVNDIAADTAGSIVKALIGQDVTADEVKRALAHAAAE